MAVTLKKLHPTTPTLPAQVAKVKQLVNLRSTCTTTPECATMGEMSRHEGKLLRELLNQPNGPRPVDFARAAELSISAVSKHMSTREFGDGAWRTIRRGLAALGLDASAIRPNEARVAGQVRDLTPLASMFNTEQLANLKEILSASKESQEALVVYYIDKRLAAYQPEAEVTAELRTRLDELFKEFQGRIGTRAGLAGNIIPTFSTAEGSFPPARAPRHDGSEADQISDSTHVRHGKKPRP